MKTIARIIIAASISFALIGSEAVAAERGRKEYNNGNRQEQPKPQQRPGNNHNSGNNKPGRPGNGNSQRPDNRPGHGNNQRPDNRPGHGNSQRPDNRPGHGNNQRPDNRPGNGNNHKPDNRPGHGNNHKPDNRPGHGNNHRPDNRPGHNHRPPQPPHGHGNNHRPNNRPGHNHRPPQPPHGHGNNHRPNNRPGHNHRPPQPPHGHAPHRPHMPGGWTHWRPAPPPPSYRPYAAWPRFSTVLGVRFGTSLALTLNALMSSGYNVVSSHNNTVYLRNVPMLGIYWPEATLCYTGSGRLSGSEFVSYNSYPDHALYNSVYSTLCANYGMPYSTSGMSAAWWGPEGQYIRLNYSSGIGVDGYTRYYTTLNFGIY